MGHNVGKAAEMAVSRSDKRNAKTTERTPEERLKQLRNNAASGLAVPGDDTRWLLALYDQSHVILAQTTNLLNSATEEVKRLAEENEQFRTVYEQENRRSEVKVEKFLGSAAGEDVSEVKVSTTVSTENRMPIEFPEVASAIVDIVDQL